MGVVGRETIERVKKSWRLFASGGSGRRFRERYWHRRSSGRGRFNPTRLLYVVGGVSLVVVSALFGWLPVLGWGTALLGLGMIAGEIHAAARLMDRLEVRARRLLGPLGKAFAGLPAWMQLSVSLGIAVSTFALVYGLYSLVFCSIIATGPQQAGVREGLKNHVA